MSLTPPIIQAAPGERIDFTIAKALQEVAKPDVAFAYFSHNGVIVTVDKASTHDTVSRDWSERLRVLCEVAMEADKTTNPANA